MSLHNFLLFHLRSHIKNSCFVFHQGFQTPRNNKSTRPSLLSRCLEPLMKHSHSFLIYYVKHLDRLKLVMIAKFFQIAMEMFCQYTTLAYRWRTWYLNWPIRNQLAGKTLQNNEWDNSRFSSWTSKKIADKIGSLIFWYKQVFIIAAIDINFVW